MQSYALLDARTPGIVSIISNKNCKEWRIDTLQKSKCVCAPLCFISCALSVWFQVVEKVILFSTNTVNMTLSQIEVLLNYRTLFSQRKRRRLIKVVRKTQKQFQMRQHRELQRNTQRYWKMAGRNIHSKNLA